MDQYATITNLAASIYISEDAAPTRNILMNSAIHVLLTHRNSQLLPVLRSAVNYLIQDELFMNDFVVSSMILYHSALADGRLLR